MTGSRRTKLVIWSIVGIAAFGLVSLGRSVYRVWDRFGSEERICGGFQPVITSLDEYFAATGSLPTNLIQLIPRYLARLPTAPVANTIDYRVLTDGTNWQLTVRSRITGSPRVFVNRSSGQFTAEEENQAVAVFHGWRGFKE